MITLHIKLNSHAFNYYSIRAFHCESSISLRRFAESGFIHFDRKGINNIYDIYFYQLTI